MSRPDPGSMERREPVGGANAEDLDGVEELSWPSADMGIDEDTWTSTLPQLADDIDALSNANRLRLLHVLTRPMYGEEIAASLQMSRQSALKHIQKLQDRGFVRMIHGRRDTGPVNEYQVVPQRLFALSVVLARLGELEPQGGSRDPVNDQTTQAAGPAPEDGPDARRTDDAGAMPGSVATHVGPSAGAADATGPGARTARLLVLDGRSAGHVVRLEGTADRWSLGRDLDRDIVLDHDPFVSGHHAEVQDDRLGHAVVDVFSANGTYVNFQRIPRGARVHLRPGDVVGVGHTHLVYQVR